MMGSSPEHWAREMELAMQGWSQRPQAPDPALPQPTLAQAPEPILDTGPGVDEGAGSEAPLLDVELWMLAGPEAGKVYKIRDILPGEAGPYDAMAVAEIGTWERGPIWLFRSEAGLARRKVFLER